MSTRDDMTMSRWDMHDHHVVMTPTCMARHQTLIVTALGLIYEIRYSSRLSSSAGSRPAPHIIGVWQPTYAQVTVATSTITSTAAQSYPARAVSSSSARQQRFVSRESTTQQPTSAQWMQRMEACLHDKQ